MIKVENIETFNWDGAIRGMRNPKNSWQKSDSKYDENGKYIIGENDFKLMKTLFDAGPEHRKYLRQIPISFDITAPLYWWKEYDTYKVGTTSNSCSTMHKIHDKEFTYEDFSCEHLIDSNDEDVIDAIGAEYKDEDGVIMNITPKEHMRHHIDILNWYRNLYNKTNNKKYWWQMIQLLPTTYNQKRTLTLDYEVAYNMIRQRKNHKLDEWRELTDTLIDKLPYMKELIGE